LRIHRQTYLLLAHVLDLTVSGSQDNISEAGFASVMLKATMKYFARFPCIRHILTSPTKCTHSALHEHYVEPSICNRRVY